MYNNNNNNNSNHTNPLADLLEDPEELARKEAQVKKPRKQPSTVRTLRCVHCKSFVRIDKRTRNYYGLQEHPICDICAVQIEQFDDDLVDGSLDRELELELELLKNPSGRSQPRLYED